MKKDGIKKKVKKSGKRGVPAAVAATARMAFHPEKYDSCNCGSPKVASAKDCRGCRRRLNRM